MINRRQVGLGLGASIASLASPGLLRAQEIDPNYPSREIKFVCGFPAGSGADTYVRYYAEKIRQNIGKPIVVENRVGANGNIATNYAARSKPDGYTIYMNAPSGLAANMHLFKNPGTDALKELTVAASINLQTFMITVSTNRPWQTLGEMVAALREKGEKGNYATNNPTGRVTGAWMAKAFGLRTQEIQYRTGADTLNDLASGALDFAAHDPVTALAQRNAGRLRILAVAVKQRMKSLPDVPTLHELGGTDIDLPSWWAAVVPAATPRPIVDKINAMFNQVTSTSETREFFAKFGADTWMLTPEEALKQFQEDYRAWGEHIKLAKIEPQG